MLRLQGQVPCIRLLNACRYASFCCVQQAPDEPAALKPLWLCSRGLSGNTGHHQAAVAAWPQLQAGVSAADVEALDTLKVSDLVYNFRCHGHLAALLDPLQRVKHGPWRSDVVMQRSATVQCSQSQLCCVDSEAHPAACHATVIV